MGIGQRLDAAAQRFDIAVQRLALGGALGDERADDGQDVLDAMVQFLVQHALAHRRPGAFVRQDFAVEQQHLDHRDAQRLGKAQIGLGPGMRAVADGFLPDREALARCQAVAQGAGLVGLVRIAAPIQGAHCLGPEIEQEIARPLRQGHDQDAGDLRGQGGRVRQMVHQAIGMEHLPVGTVLRQAQQRAHQVAPGCVAQGRPFAVEPQPDPFGGDQFRQLRQAAAQGVRGIVAAAGIDHQVVQRPTGHDFRVAGAAAAQRVELHREEFAHHLGRGALGHAQDARGIMVAGDQAPKRPVENDRDRHRGRDTHVAQVFAMNGRDAAQMGIGQVQRPVLGPGQDRDRGKGHVPDHPDRVAQIQRPRLPGNVACREILAAKAFVTIALGLGHDLAGTVGSQFIDHHPVIAQLRLQQQRGLLDQALGRLGGAQAADDGARHAQHRTRQRGRGLELDDGAFVEPMRGDIQHAAVDFHAEQGRGLRHGAGQRNGQGVAQGMARLAPDHLGQEAPDRGAVQVQHRSGIGRMVQDLPHGVVAGQQAAMGLDAAGNVDRLAVAIGQVDGLAGQHHVRSGDFRHAVASSRYAASASPKTERAAAPASAAPAPEPSSQARKRLQRPASRVCAARWRAPRS